MQPFAGKPTPPTDDRRWKLVDAAMRKHGHEPSALIESLHSVQEAFGYLDERGLRYVALSLRVPFSKVYGVSTFYHFFTLKPHGEHTCVVCKGTACYVKGADALIAAVERAGRVHVGETTANGRLSLLTARCLGACGIAPAVVIDDTVKGHQSPEGLLEAVKGWL